MDRSCGALLGQRAVLLTARLMLSLESYFWFTSIEVSNIDGVTSSYLITCEILREAVDALFD